MTAVDEPAPYNRRAASIYGTLQLAPMIFDGMSAYKVAKTLKFYAWVWGKQCLSRKLNHPDKKDTYNGQNSAPDTFVSDPHMSEHTYLDYEDFSVQLQDSCRTPAAGL